MGTTHQRATGQQQKYFVPGVAFDDAQFDAVQAPRNVEGSQSMMTVSPIATVATVRTLEAAPAASGPASTVFAGMSAKLTTWRFAEDSWRTDDDV